MCDPKLPSAEPRHPTALTRRPTGAEWRVGAPVRAFVASRALVLGCVFASVIFVNSDPSAGPWPRLDGPRVAFLRALGRWDSAWYLDVSRRGYRGIRFGKATHASEAFFPGYPLIVRFTSTVMHTPRLLAALLVTSVFGVITVIVLWRLVSEYSGTAAARRAVTLFCFSPGSFVLSMGYSESLYVCMAALSLLMLTHRRWWAAGACAALAGFTRPNGIALVLTCVVVACVAVHRRRDWSAFIAPLLGSLGIMLYFSFLLARTGKLLTWFAVERQGWGDRVAPISGFVHHLAGLRHTSLHPTGMNDAVWIAFTLLGGIGLVLLARWRPPLPVALYGTATALLAASSYQVGLRPRMLLTAFPILLAAGACLRGYRYRLVLAASIVCLVVLSLLTFGTEAVFP